MLRRISRFAARPLVLLLALAAGALAVCGPDSVARSRATQPPPARLIALPELTPQYTLQDGTILYDGQEKTTDDGQPAAPGKVDALNIKAAYERAGKLAGQAKGKVFKTTITPHWFN